MAKAVTKFTEGLNFLSNDFFILSPSFRAEDMSLIAHLQKQTQMYKTYKTKQKSRDRSKQK